LARQRSAVNPIFRGHAHRWGCLVHPDRRDAHRAPARRQARAELPPARSGLPQARRLGPEEPPELELVSKRRGQARRAAVAVLPERQVLWRELALPPQVASGVCQDRLPVRPDRLRGVPATAAARLGLPAESAQRPARGESVQRAASVGQALSQLAAEVAWVALVQLQEVRRGEEQAAVLQPAARQGAGAERLPAAQRVVVRDGPAVQPSAAVWAGLLDRVRLHPPAARLARPPSVASRFAHRSLLPRTAQH
jgi:hypothetical protein